ncbi:hypothetical protein ISF_01893 [Cordyceps fumosorosea ARSEF 2679]|uniref:Uncharacterized protein n=1 Tax=Cordyceps fumosorosea (strain ARSEF 2679) TaxID=1081104 RepID=A0A162JN57_CORFA|nr:hypothetical protein ISF_01893 [Cordyceps fumosorosea ARSEF 2679]OAA71342.1 hypothetical protein ISF_01893 [Cordyceps fumosorosea ARSEF 2679]
MKAATIVLAALMGHALAAPPGTDPKAPEAGSKEAICLQASVAVFDKCFEARGQGFMPAAKIQELRERCNKERDDAKQDCLDVEEVGGEILDKDAANKKKAECAVPGNRIFAQCMKDRFVNKSGETKEDCEKKRKEATEACIKGEQPAKPEEKEEEATPSESETADQQPELEDC